MEPHVKVLREFRDRFLLTTNVGRSFLDLYYTYSPPVASFIARHDTVRLAVRWTLLPLVGLSYVAMYLGPAAALGLVVLLLCLVGASTAIAVSRMRLRRQA